MDRRRILTIAFIVFTNILGAGVIIPILPLLAVDRYGASEFQAAILAALFFAAQFVAAPIFGRISDRVGRRPVLIISQIGTVLSFIMFIYADRLGGIIDGLGLSFGMTGGLIALYLARTLDGFTGGNITIAQAYITDVSTPETRAQALGMLGAAFGLGFIIGPASGGLLATISLTAPFIGAAIVTTGSVILTTLLLEESLPPEKRTDANAVKSARTPMTEFLKVPTILLIMAIGFCFSMALSVLQSTFALFADRALFPSETAEIVARNVGFILMFIGIFSVINQAILIGPLVKRFGEQKLLLFCAVSLMIGFLGYGTSSSMLQVILFAAPISFGIGISQPSLQSLITRFGTDQTRGQLIGLYQAGNNLAFILGPIWAGYVFETISPQAPYFAVVPLGIVIFAFAFSLLQSEIPMRQQPDFAVSSSKEIS
ncbi:MAG: MFS transporter [Chloroflexota bacterium]